MDKIATYDKIEKLFVCLYDAAASELTLSEIYEIQEFVDVGEYGLALETSVAIYFEERKKPTKETLLILRDLALLMKKKPEEILRKIGDF